MTYCPDTVEAHRNDERHQPSVRCTHRHLEEWPGRDLFSGCDLTFGTNVGEVNTSKSDKLETLVHVLDFLDAHARDLVVSAKTGITNDFLFPVIPK